MNTRVNASSVQTTEEVASSRASPPRRVLRSRQGKAGVIVNTGVGSPSFIVAVGQVSETFCISKCSDKRCKTCPNLNTSKTIQSNVTHKKYEVINPINEGLTCHSRNIVYLLACKICFVQYVGETAYPLHVRMNQHRTSKEGCEHIIDHCETICEGHNFAYQILEKLPGSGLDQFDKVDENVSKRRREREDDWMKKLRTIFPYGLNERVKDKNFSDESPIGNRYPPIPRTGIRPIRSRENRNNRFSAVSAKDFFDHLDHLLKTNVRNSFFEIRVILDRAKKKVLKEIAFHLMERDVFVYSERYEPWYVYISDIIDTKLYKTPSQTLKPTPKNVCTVRFSNKGIDDIKLPQIFRSPEVIALLPPSLQADDEIPTVTMKLDPPIRNKIFNYKDTVTCINVEIDEDVSFVTNLPSCDCDSSSFSDPHHKHIVTGDLRIIENSKLRKLLSKGPSFRESKTINYSKCKTSIETALDLFILKLVSKSGFVETDLKEWKEKVIRLVSEKIRTLKSLKVPQQTKPVLDDPDVQQYLKDLHDKFVLVPIDKASNNIAIICKRFYICRILEELGIPGDRSSTYKLSSCEKESIIDTNITLCEKLGLSIDDNQKKLPFMYWMPKMHYTPSRARFIVASGTCSTKPISQVISKIFKKIFHQTQSFHKKCTFYKNYNRFWVVENSTPIIEKLDHINVKRKAREISTYDFSTLYTNLPHKDLLRVLNGNIDFVFNGGKHKADGNRKFLTPDYKWAYFSRKKYGKASFTRNKLKSVVEHLITQTYFEVGNLVLHQSIGIPMGIDPAPFWANLYLYSYEHDFITSLMKSDKKRAFRFLHASRFIDDELNLNDCGEFGKSFHLIYPKELQLKCEHQGTHATFLELDIEVVEGVFVYKLFDKRDNFPFHIVRMPDLGGNIPQHVFYGAIMSEFLRIARATLRFEDFVPKASNLFKRMVAQGGSNNKVLCQIRKAIIRHPEPFKSFRKSYKDIIKHISE